MTSLRLVFILLLHLFLPPLFAGDKSDLQSTVDSWKWADSIVEVTAPDSSDALLVSIAYKKPSIVDDTDSYGVRLRSNKTASFTGCWGTGKTRCGQDGGCSGGARIEGISKGGFRVVLDLHWSNKPMGEGDFKEGFDCKWTPEQSFVKDGFSISVTVKQKNS